MKIKNEKVSVINGKKKYDLRNYIFDTYLQTFLTRAVATSKYAYQDLLLDLLYIKFDDELDVDTETALISESFDVMICLSTDVTQNMTSNAITATYKYNCSIPENANSYFVDINSGKSYNMNKYSFNEMYLGRKITALGFANFYSSSTIHAYLDVSKYDIYIQAEEDLKIVRTDIITTDSIFYSNSENVTAPLHLAPFLNPELKITSSLDYFLKYRYAILYSIGVSKTANDIDEEGTIGDSSISYSEDKLKAFVPLPIYSLEQTDEIYPSVSLYPGVAIYPLTQNYKYVILKYKIYEYSDTLTDSGETKTDTDTGEFYLQVTPIDTYGEELNYKITFERG